MAALTVWKFDTVEGAGQALSKLEDLSKQQLINIEAAFEGTEMNLIRSNLTNEQEAKLREDFAG